MSASAKISLEKDTYTCHTHFYQDPTLLVGWRRGRRVGCAILARLLRDAAKRGAHPGKRLHHARAQPREARQDLRRIELERLRAAACAAAPRGGRERTSGAGSDGAAAAAAASSILARAAAVARYASCSDPCDAADGLCGTFSKRVFITPLASAADMLSGRRLIGRPPTLAGRGLQRSDPPDPQEPAL